MKLLAIDTSGDACSAALMVDDSIEQRLEIAPRRHGELILPMMQSLLDEAGIPLTDLHAIAFGRGPGSFTGVRIATAVAQGTAFGARVPAIPVSTLAAMAQGQFRRGGQTRLLTALDARMDEVYWGAYRIESDRLAHPCIEERVCPPSEVPSMPEAGWHGTGSGWATYAESLSTRIGGVLSDVSPDAICEARDIALLAAAEYQAGRHFAPEFATPVYLRNQVTRAA